MTMQAQITAKLTEAFAPTALDVIDESDQHHGHAGWREGGETHFRVVMESQQFSGMSRVARQRAVYKCLADELATTVHALALDLRPPEGA